jgi:hypothetical protein
MKLWISIPSTTKKKKKKLLGVGEAVISFQMQVLHTCSVCAYAETTRATEEEESAATWQVREKLNGWEHFLLSQMFTLELETKQTSISLCKCINVSKIETPLTCQLYTTFKPTRQ